LREFSLELVGPLPEPSLSSKDQRFGHYTAVVLAELLLAFLECIGVGLVPSPWPAWQCGEVPPVRR
jgi:hypothetical protein